MSSSSKCVCPRHMWHTKDSDSGSGSGSGCGGATWMRHVSAHRKNLETWRCVRLSGKVALWLREKCSPKSMKSQLATWLEPVARGSPSARGLAGDIRKHSRNVLRPST